MVFHVNMMTVIRLLRMLRLIVAVGGAVGAIVPHSVVLEQKQELGIRLMDQKMVVMHVQNLRVKVVI